MNEDDFSLGADGDASLLVVIPELSFRKAAPTDHSKDSRKVYAVPEISGELI